MCPILDMLAAMLGRTRATLRLYDPYYCDGSVVKKLNKLGFMHVYNRYECSPRFPASPPSSHARTHTSKHARI